MGPVKEKTPLPSSTSRTEITGAMARHTSPADAGLEPTWFKSERDGQGV
jgi:hypothetical protein